jgi:hypothetical protein
VFVLTTEEGKFIQSYPELHHYTGWEALKGIFTLNSMWATHYQHLNDRTEVSHMKEYLSSLVPRNRAERRNAKIKIQQLYDKTFKQFVTPYIVSFSTHAAGSDFDRENGILSQWAKTRGSDGVEIGGYGRHGYAIVFDTAQLNDLINKEFETYLYTQTVYSNVVYNYGIDAFRAAFDALIQEAAWFIWDREAETPWGHRSLPKNYARAEQFISDFVKTTVSFKHLRWSQEQEVRIVAHPKDPSELVHIRDSDPDDIRALRNRQPKEIHLREKDGQTIRFIKLFDGLKADLPIKRIIVAPDEDQNRLYEQVRRLVGNRVPIHCSKVKLSI